MEKIRVRIKVIGVDQVLQYRFRVVLLHTPDKRGTSIYTEMRIAQIKNIFESLASAAVIQQCNAGRTTVNPSVHFLVPDFQRSAGDCIRSLCMDHDLFVEGILVNRCSGIQERHPTIRIACDLFVGILEQSRHRLKFRCHRAASILPGKESDDAWNRSLDTNAGCFCCVSEISFVSLDSHSFDRFCIGI